MIDLLALLKRIQFSDGEVYNQCLACGARSDTDGQHMDGCELKQAMDALESGALQVIDLADIPDPPET